MEKSEIYLKTLPDKWINKDTKQKVQIFKHGIETYIAEYDPPLQLSREVQNEEIKIIQLSNELSICKLTNCYGSWTMKFLSRDKFYVSNNPEINPKPITCIFERIKSIDI